MSDFGRFVGFRRMTAGCQRVLFASRMSALVALFRSGAVTLGCSFMMIGGSGVRIFRH